MPPNPYANAPRLPDDSVIDPRRLFAHGSPIELELEIGPGRGWFMIDRLIAEPDVCMLGLEVSRKWTTEVNARLARRGLSERGRVYAEDVKIALTRLAASSIARVFIHFPDPWWKKRHRKRRVIADDVLGELARMLVPDGELFVQTDVPERANDYEAAIGCRPEFSPRGVARLIENPYGAQSPRERRAIADGLPVYRLRYFRQAKLDPQQPDRLG